MLILLSGAQRIVEILDREGYGELDLKLKRIAGVPRIEILDAGHERVGHVSIIDGELSHWLKVETFG